ncbi:MAG: flavodoxin [Candidatus Absconditicoccaceae bacterium]
MNKNLIIFYSLDGNTKFIAEYIAFQIGADLLQLQPIKGISNIGFMKYLRGGRQVLMKNKPELQSRDIDPNDYEKIFIGTPVRAYNYAPALRTFFDKVVLKNKKIALFCCHEGGKGKTLENMEEILKGNEIIGKIDFFAPLKKDKEEQVKKLNQRLSNNFS